MTESLVGLGARVQALERAERWLKRQPESWDTLDQRHARNVISELVAALGSGGVVSPQQTENETTDE